MAGPPPLLEIRDLVTSFPTAAGARVRAVDGLSLSIPPVTAVGVVGESGSGKSVTALSILGLIQPPGRIDSGQILYRPQGSAGSADSPSAADNPVLDLRKLSERQLRSLRGNRLAMIFQEPMTSLNPVYTVGDQVGEALRVHRGLSRRAALAEATSLFQQVGIADPGRRVHEYPHQLSGGMRQRVMIAMALSCGPDLLIADEPTTALDVTIQAQILDLLGRLQHQLGMSMLLITHDLGIVARTCAQAIVMYAGQAVEQAATAALFSAPRHPYTAGLLRSMPRLRSATAPRRGPGARPRLQEIPGLVPRLDQLPPGCRFADRCPSATARCRAEAPDLRDLPDVADPLRKVRCHYPLGAVAEAA